MAAVQRVWSTCLTFVLIGLLSFTAMAQDDELSERRAAAQALADNAFDLMQKGLYEDAADLFRKADERFHSPVFQLFEAEAHEKQGKLLKTRVLLAAISDEKLAEYAPDAFRNAQKKARVKLVEIDKRIPTLAVSLPGANTSEVTINIGARSMTGAEASTPLRLEPGSYTVEAVAKNGRRDETTLTLAEGERRNISLDVATQGAVTPDPDENAGDGAPWWLGGAIALGVGGVGLVIGAVVGGVFIGDANALKEKCENFPAPGSDPNQCPPETEGDGDDVKVLGNVATVGFVVAGVGAVVGTTLLIFMAEDGDSEVALRIAPNGIAFRGRF